MTIRPIHIALAITGTTLGMVLAAAILLLTQRRQPVAFDCGASANPELIVQSGPEYILANPSVSDYSNSYLVSSELQDPNGLPARWRFQDSRVLRSDASGLDLKASADSGGSSHSFNSASGEWRSVHAGDSRPTVVRCRRLAALPASTARLTGVPLAYLVQRPWPLPLLNPDLREIGLRLSLARALIGRSGSEYSLYKLLSPLPRTALSAADEEQLQAARKALLSELSSSTSFWSYSGSSSATWEYSNEQQEAKRHADSWCRERSEGSLNDRLAEGWQVVASVAQVIDSGQQKHLYPDGRFAGYVNYTASCQGTLHTLRKEGDLRALP